MLGYFASEVFLSDCNLLTMVDSMLSMSELSKGIKTIFSIISFFVGIMGEDIRGYIVGISKICFKVFRVAEQKSVASDALIPLMNMLEHNAIQEKDLEELNVEKMLVKYCAYL